jgi:hypothetical protein
MSVDKLCKSSEYRVKITFGTYQIDLYTDAKNGKNTSQ